MKIIKQLAVGGLAVAVLAGSADAAAARVIHRHYRHYGSRHGVVVGGAGLAAGAALGLLGLGIAGAAAADNGYGSAYPAYGSGYSGFGYYGPGYGYYGY